MEYPFKDLLPLDEVLEREGYYKDWTHLDPEVFYSLTQISNFIKTKGYGVDVRLLIAQLAEHFGLKTTQVVDLGNLLTAKHATLKTQVEQAVSQVNADRNALETQFNQSVAQMQAEKDAVIANATVDSEVILARGDKPTLQARLDDAATQLAQIAILITDPPTPLEPAIGDGVTNDTSAIQAILDYASTVSGSVLVPAGRNFLVDELTVKDGTKSFEGGGVIKGSGSSVNGLVKLGTNQQKLKNATISLNIDMGGGDVFGLYGYVENCDITNNKVYNFVDDESKRYGILFQEGSKNNKVNKNTVTGTHNPTGGYQFMIMFLSGVTEAWGGLYDGQGGTPVRAVNGSRENIVSENTATGGTHGIVINGGIANIITGNVCKYNSHRGIILEPSCFDNVVNNNELHAFGSAGILMGYGCCDNLIANNQFTDDLSVFPPDGEGAIAVYVGCNDNKITGNKIKSYRRYGVYLAVDVQNNIIENNTIEGYRRAGIAIESDWIPVGSSFESVTLPLGAKYSRPNYAGSPRYNTAGIPIDRWGYKSSKGNIIQHNQIKRGSAESAAIYLSQIGESLILEENTIQNNVIDEALSNYFYLYMYEDKTNMLGKNTLKNNNFMGGIAITPGKFNFESRFFTERLGNTYVDNADLNLETQIEQPSVKVGESFRLINTSATNITNFADGYDGQTITVRLDGFSTIKHSSNSLRLKNNEDITPRNSNSFITLKRVTGIWFEMTRNF